MGAVVLRNVDHRLGDTRMRGLLVAPEGASALPTVVLVHDAFGLGDDMIAIARKLAERGFAVFAADVWGERATPLDQSGIEPLMGSMVGNRTEWLARIGEAHRTAAAQPEVDADSMAMLGYCFGGSSALEFVRAGGRVRGVIAIHPGLDILEHDWSAADAAGVQALICVGSIDPMATAEQRRRDYHPRNAARAWTATTRFLAELFPDISAP